MWLGSWGIRMAFYEAQVHVWKQHQSIMIPNGLIWQRVEEVYDCGLKLRYV
jgi:hypothetical protein